MNKETITIAPPRLEVVEFRIIGTAPFVQLKFSEKAKDSIRAKHEAGSVARKGTKREARDFEEDFRGALHVSDEGWYGIPAGAFRSALISACRLVGFKMTLAKLSIFVEADGFDKAEGIPLIQIEGTPEPLIMHTRNATGVVDLRVRGKYWPWSANVRVKFDADQFTRQDVANLLMRVGEQVGIGEGRPDSKSSTGMGWGTFRLASEGE